MNLTDQEIIDHQPDDLLSTHYAWTWLIVTSTPENNKWWHRETSSWKWISDAMFAQRIYTIRSMKDIEKLCDKTE